MQYLAKYGANLFAHEIIFTLNEVWRKLMKISNVKCWGLKEQASTPLGKQETVYEIKTL